MSLRVRPPIQRGPVRFFLTLKTHKSLDENSKFSLEIIYGSLISFDIKLRVRISSVWNHSVQIICEINNYLSPSHEKSNWKTKAKDEMYGGYYPYKDNGMIIVFKGERKATTYILYRGIRILILTFNCDIYNLPPPTSEYIIYVYSSGNGAHLKKNACILFLT